MRRILWFVAIIGLLYSGVHLGAYYFDSNQVRQEYESLADLNHSSVQELDFSELLEINSDTVGWIEVEGTTIDYPLLQWEDNQKYLITTFYQKNNSAGAIFVDRRNSADFSDSHTVIYGHNMKNGMMFEPLLNYQEPAFYAAHPTFTIYTPEGEWHYEVFSAYVTVASSDSYILSFDQEGDFENFLNYLQQLSVIETDVSGLTATDRIVTLSTCDNTFGDARMVVHGRLIK